jgi:hypothetical protein
MSDTMMTNEISSTYQLEGYAVLNWSPQLLAVITITDMTVRHSLTNFKL